MASARPIPAKLTRAAWLRLFTALLIVGAGVSALAISSRTPDPPALPASLAQSPASSSSSTSIAIGTEVLHHDVQRFGINLTGQTFYDSGQMLKNLVSRNPGFEGETWQANFRCKSATTTSCSQNDAHIAWPSGFLDDASFQIISGPARGASGTVASSFAAPQGKGFTLTFASPVPQLSSGDFLQVRLEKPGNAQAGWWTSTSGGATLATEFHDLSPNTPGKQALRIDAPGPGQNASVSSYFDSLEGHSFVQLHGVYALRFRAKWLSGDRTITTRLARGNRMLFSQDVVLSPQWHDYAIEIPLAENGSSLGTVGLTFFVQHAAVLIDDVELEPARSTSANPTAFRDEVVETLRDLSPGILRFMDNGTSFGSTLDDLLAAPFARHRAGILFATTSAEDIPIGLHDALVLAQAIHADPWYTLPATLSPHEASNLLEYLAGPPSTVYGGKRAAFGQSAPWTSVFHTIHLEFGNEMWGTYPGASISDPAAYQDRASAIFAAITASPYFSPAAFDLVGNAQSENLWWTGQAIKNASRQTSIDFAPYLFGQLNDFSSSEAVFGDMFAEPEAMDTTGIVAQQARLLRTSVHPLKPEIYEVNLGTVSSTNPAIVQSQIDSTVASLGAGLAVVDHMLLMLRELGITDQCFFALPEFQNVFTAPGKTLRTPLFGAVSDMGGSTNRRRPVYYALQLANSALLRDELITHLSGANPVWDQPASLNTGSAPSHPHLLQTFAFGEGQRRSLILLNLSRSTALPVTFSGPGAPHAKVSESRLSARNITDTNEQEPRVAPVRVFIPAFDPSIPYSLPPFSMTVLEWQGPA